MLKHLLKLGTNFVRISLIIGSARQHLICGDMRGYPFFLFEKIIVFTVLFLFQFLLLDPLVWTQDSHKQLPSSYHCWTIQEISIDSSYLHFQNLTPDDAFKTAPPSFFPFPVMAVFSFQVLGPKSLGSLTLLSLTSNIQIFGRSHWSIIYKKSNHFSSLPKASCSNLPSSLTQIIAITSLLFSLFPPLCPYSIFSSVWPSTLIKM